MIRLPLCWLVSVACLSGCVTPVNTELPTLGTPPPAIEGQRYRLHDPFADEDAGPDTDTRPPSFMEQREEPRRTLESRSLMGADPFLGPAAVPPPRSSTYPRAVQ